MSTNASALADIQRDFERVSPEIVRRANQYAAPGGPTLAREGSHMPACSFGRKT